MKYLYEIVTLRPSTKEPMVDQEVIEYYVAESIYDAINQTLKNYPRNFDTNWKLIGIKETVAVLHVVESQKSE